MDSFGENKDNFMYGQASANEVRVVEGATRGKTSLWPLFISLVATLVICIVVFLGFGKWKEMSSDNMNNSTDNKIVLNEHLIEKQTVATPTGNIVLMPTISAMLKTEEFKDASLGFAINSPVGWYTDSTKKTGASVVFLNPATEVINGTAYATFISVTVGNTGEVLLDDQIKVTKRNILNDYPTYMIQNEKELVLGGRVYRLLEGYYYAKNVKMKNKNLITIYNKRGYAISATAPEASWDKSSFVIDMSMNTFKLL